MYYPCSENKGADQLRGYREADLRLCFRICKTTVFSRRGSLFQCCILYKENNRILYSLHCVQKYIKTEQNILEMITEYKHEHLSLVVRKPAFCIYENKDAYQLRGNREADQRLCFRYTDTTIPLLSKSEISSLWPSAVTAQPGFVSDQVRNSEDRFSHSEAYLIRG